MMLSNAREMDGAMLSSTGGGPGAGGSSCPAVVSGRQETSMVRTAAAAIKTCFDRILMMNVFGADSPIQKKGMAELRTPFGYPAQSFLCCKGSYFIK